MRRNRRSKRARDESQGASRKSGRRGWSRRFAKWLGIALLAFVVFTATPVLLMRWVNPFSSAFMLKARCDALWAGEYRYRNQYAWADFERISPDAALAVVAAEDQQFPFHYGFDIKSIRDAAVDNARGKRVRGASTISQQVAKNLFLWSGRSYLRKGLEAWFTMLIELTWPKQRILEVYLNIAELGRGVYGVETAARQFYHHSAKQLTRYEAATLAAVLPNPRRFRADKPSRYVASRRDWIVGQMRMLGGRSYLEPLKPPA
jgi:monofunctional biosynthetic peptidoglycan transglycosylase